MHLKKKTNKKKKKNIFFFENVRYRRQDEVWPPPSLIFTYLDRFNKYSVLISLDSTNLYDDMQNVPELFSILEILTNTR